MLYTYKCGACDKPYTSEEVVLEWCVPCCQKCERAWAIDDLSRSL